MLPAQNLLNLLKYLSAFHQYNIQVLELVIVEYMHNLKF
jgi:hypothetical protein